MKKFIIGLLIGLGLISTIALGGTVLTTGTSLFPQQGGTGLRLQPAAGDILYGSSTTSFTHLLIGTNGQVLKVSSTAGVIYWGTDNNTGGGSGSVSTSSPITTNNFPFWVTAGGGLSGTSTITTSGGNVTIANELTADGLRSTSSTLSNVSGIVTFLTQLISNNFRSTSATISTINGALTADDIRSLSSTITSLNFVNGTSTTNLALSYGTASRCLRLDANKNVVVATGDCTAGDTTVTGADPTATVGLTAVNGVATTFLRSDGAPALSQSIAPTWTGLHTWSVTSTFNATVKFASSTASRCARFDANQNLVSATGDCTAGDTDTGGGGGMATSTLGVYTEGNIAFFTNHSTLSASSSFRITSSTGLLQNFGTVSSTDFRTPSATITTINNAVTIANITGNTTVSNELTNNGFRSTSATISLINGAVTIANITGNTTVSGELTNNGFRSTSSTIGLINGAVTIASITGPTTISSVLTADDFRSASSTITTLRFTNASGTNMTLTGYLTVAGDAVTTSTGANPSASLGLSVINGTANTFLRSDAAPALSQSIAPTWTGLHIWSTTSTFNATAKFASSTASRCARFDANQNLVSATGDCTAGDTTGTGGGGTVSTSTRFVIGELALVHGTSTLHSTSSLSYVSSTGLLQNFGTISSTDFRSNSSTFSSISGVVTFLTQLISNNFRSTSATISTINSPLTVTGFVGQTSDIFTIASSTNNFFTISPTGTASFLTGGGVASTTFSAIPVSSPTSTIQFGASGTPACIIIRDANNGGYTYMTTSAGVATFSTSACGTARN